MENRQTVRDLHTELVEGIYLRNYMEKGSYRAMEDLRTVNGYIEKNNLVITADNYEEIKQEVINIIDSTVISLN